MRIGVIGINHKLADLTLRETLARAFQSCFIGSDHLNAFVLLTTCNRIELYFSSSDLAETHTYILTRLKLEVECEQKLYSFFGTECFLHLTKVAAGFDSAIIAETEIQGQVKQAYANACSTKKLPPILHQLFQKSLQISKFIRSKYAIGRGMPDIEHAIFQTAAHFFSTPHDRSILFVGSSTINQKVLEYLLKKGCSNITLCNRTRQNAEKLSSKYQIPLLPFSKLKDWVEFDWIILGTSAPHYLIQKQEELPNSKLIIDLALPRNADPLLGEIPSIQLLNIDQLNRMLKFRRKWIDSAITKAEAETAALVKRHSHLVLEKMLRITQLQAC